VRKPEQKRQRLLGRRRHKWEDNTKLDLKDTFFEGRAQDCSGSSSLVGGAPVKTVVNLWLRKM
jgi:hypothetical protein